MNKENEEDPILKSADWQNEIIVIGTLMKIANAMDNGTVTRYEKEFVTALKEVIDAFPE